MVSKQVVASKLIEYLYHQISLAELVDWAEEAMREEEFEESNLETVRDIVSRLGLADVKAFGLTWEDCEDYLSRLGYQVYIEVEAAT